MINLIPPEGHKVMRREYLLRAWSTILLLFSCVVIFLTIALIPAYVLTNAQIKAFELETEQKNGNDDIYANVEKEVQVANSMLNQFKTPSPSMFSSAVIEEIKNSAPASIAFSTFQVNTTGVVIDTVQIQGVAPTREALAQLKLKLEASPMFEKAEVPIADLAKDTNLPFTITITLAQNN